jgi:integral membrane protein
MRTRELRWLLLCGRLEALSFLLLLGVAMPLKHLMDMPLATKLVGWPHGILFLVYCYLVLEAAGRHRFGTALTAGLLVAALLPFGPFVAERRLRRFAG